MKVVVETQVLSGVLLPVILVMMLLLINRKDLMGSFVNPRWMNVVAWTTAGIVVVLSVALYRCCRFESFAVPIPRAVCRRRDRGRDCGRR